MSGLLAVVPVIGERRLPSPPAQIGLASMLAEGSALGLAAIELLVVDNTRLGLNPDYVRDHLPGVAIYRDPDGHNLGVARSWNVGARAVLDRGLDYLVLLSSVVQFGPILHCTWRSQMETFWGERVIEAEGHSWHLIALHRTVLEGVGLFDSNFYPAYVEAEDYSFRMRQLGWEGGWTRVWVNALSQGHGLHVPLVSCPWGPLGAYRAAKWGGGKHEETFTLPFGDKPLDYFEDVPIPELARRYGLEVWW